MSETIRAASIGWSLAMVLVGCETAAEPLVDSETSIAYLANGEKPKLDSDWVRPGFDDSEWSRGHYRLGYDTSETPAELLPTRILMGARSVFTRARFTVDDPASIDRLLLTVDYDDAFAAWINGVEVARSSTMPDSGHGWTLRTGSHQWSNGAETANEFIEVPAAGVRALRKGVNVLAVGVWNRDPISPDLILSARLEADPEPSVIRGPYLQRASPDGIVVRWRTDISEVGGVLYGSRPVRLKQRIDVGERSADHAVSIDGLEPDTRYYYAIAGPNGPIAGGDENYTFVTPPAPGEARPVRVWILGDPGEGGAEAKSVRDAYEEFSADRAADLIVTLGDNAYPVGSDRDYQRKFFGIYGDQLRSATLWTAFGNHDGRTSDSDSQSGPYYDAFTLPTRGESGGIASGTEAYYSFDHGNAHFIVLDTDESDLALDSPMLDWLKRDLQSAKSDWIIACFHHPPYSAGRHHSDAPGHRMEEVRQNVVPLLDRYGVAMTFAGHDHDYERSYLVAGHYGTSETLADRMLFDTGDGRPGGSGAYCVPKERPNGMVTGTVHTVIGSSGRVDDEGALDHPVMAVNYEKLGSVVLDIDGDRVTSRFVGADGSILDSFTIERRDDCRVNGR